MDTARWVQLLITTFPGLSKEDFDIVDQPSTRYNCIAYAAGDTSKRWDPDENYYWPPWATPDDRIESLIEVFDGLGFQQCDDGHLEDRYQKVALYEVQGEAKHAAAQMPSGRWRSKMGHGPVIEHRSPESLSAGIYGEPTIFMRRATDDLDRSAGRNDIEP